jgi:hypothetical protein
MPDGQSLGSSHDLRQVKPLASEPAQVIPAQQFRLSGPHVAFNWLQAASQTLALLSDRARHWVPGQSASVVHTRRQVKMSVPLCPAQVVPSQHAGLFGPHAAVSAPQLQNCAAAQKPLVLFEKGTQQPVSHCALVVQFGRQPEYSGFVDSTHEPRQQSFGVVLDPGVQASARRLQGFVHASSSAHTSTPVS